MTEAAFLQTSIPGIPARRGKVRDIYDFGDRLLFVATDRISAFDWVLPNGIPDKGRVLTGLSEMWFRRLATPPLTKVRQGGSDGSGDSEPPPSPPLVKGGNEQPLRVKSHLISMDLTGVPLPGDIDHRPLQGRSMVVRKTEVVPIECVVRGYLSGSGWKEYRQSGSVCGIRLPAGLRESDKLPEPIFTPTTKAHEGHDEPMSFDQVCQAVGPELAGRLRELSLDIYCRGAEYALSKGIIIADTKFEFGQAEGELLLIDEVLTPDSSRFWPVALYEPGRSQPSFDKQFVRDWLETTGWDKNSPPPPLPDEIVARTREKYIEAYRKLVGTEFPWQ